jgi:hypothetical protein
LEKRFSTSVKAFGATSIALASTSHLDHFIDTKLYFYFCLSMPGRPVTSPHHLPHDQHCLNTLNIIHHNRDHVNAAFA